jgi:hypothetical protein
MDSFGGGSFTESEILTFENTAQNTTLNLMTDTGSPYGGSPTKGSPNKFNKTEADFLNAVAKKTMSSHHPDYLTGYTGSKMSMKRPPEKEHREIVPSLGYSGSYLGKVEGKLGKINLHRESISRQDESRSNRTRLSDDRNEYDPSIEGNYRNAIIESQCRGQTVPRILEEMSSKINFKFKSIAEKKMRIKSTFEGCDLKGNGLITPANFHMCCVQLNIALPREEFTALISYFDECNSGDIKYRHFINIICPGAYEHLSDN